MAHATPKARRPASQKATTSPALQQYRISFQIRDGDNEYYKDIIMDCDHEPTEAEQVGEVFLQYGITDYVAYSEKVAKKLKAAAWKQYQDDGFLELGRDYRIIADIGIEPEPDDIKQIKAVNAELLSALQAAFVYICENNQDSSGDRPETFEKIQSALAKAEGRSG